MGACMWRGIDYHIKTCWRMDWVVSHAIREATVGNCRWTLCLCKCKIAKMRHVSKKEINYDLCPSYEVDKPGWEVHSIH